MINGVFLINTYGDTLVQKAFASTKQPWSPQMFFKKALKHKDTKILTPCITIDEVYYVQVKRNDVFVVVASDTPDLSSFIIVECLNEFIKQICDLIGELTSDNVLDRISVVYELVIKTFGLCYPDEVSTSALNECKQLGEKSSTDDWIFPFIPDNLFGVSPSREDKYKRDGSASRAPLAPQQREKSNDLFLDLKEFVTVLIDWDGKVIFSDLKGVISSKSYLAVPVSLQISLSNKVSCEKSPEGADEKIVLTSKRFHAICTSEEHKKREEDFPLVTHLANPGYSDILDYHVKSTNLVLPFTMYHSFSKTSKGSMTELTLTFKLFCALPSGISPINWLATLPMPSKLQSVKAISSLASMTFSEDKDHKFLSMKAPIFPSRSHHSITIKLLLSHLLPFMPYEISYLNIQFEVPDLCISNMTIQSLKVQNVTTNTTQAITKWIRRSTHSKDYKFNLKTDWMD